jgi:protein-S-isoprenylcysteine O-methyltransferase Ste14
VSLEWPTQLTPLAAIYVLWAAYFLSWSIAALWSARTLARPIGPLAVLDRILFLAGFGLLFGLLHLQDAALQALRLPHEVGWVLAGVTVIGFALCWWARVHLGPLWSTMITRKEGHKIVDTGPYALVRHPIYTGLLLAVFATAAERATRLAYAGAGIMLVALLLRVWREERFLSEEFGMETYAAYRARVPALIPFLRLP